MSAPFGRSAIELTKMLCEILQVGELRKCACMPAPCAQEPGETRRAALGAHETGQPSWAFFFFFLITEWAVIRLPCLRGVVAGFV